MRRRASATGIVMALAVCLYGCGARQHADGAVRHAGNTALAYVDAFFSGRFTRAESLVLPKSRAVVAALEATVSPESVAERDLRVGTVVVRRDTATVVITGTLCTTASRLSIRQARARGQRVQCITNNDPHRDSPIFQVQLYRRMRWYVGFRRFSGTGKP